MEGNVQKVRDLLMENNKLVNERNELNKSTPIMNAAKLGNLEIVKILLEYKANLQLVDENKANVFHYASQGSRVVLSFLLSECPVINCIDLRDNLGSSPIHYAAEAGKVDCLLGKK